MNSPRFDRFVQPQFLQRIGRERLTQILLPFAPELLAHGIALPATALPDEVFFIVLAAVARRPEGMSAPLLDAMMAIEVINDVFPDERAPLVVTELRFRLRSAARPILLSSSGQHGALECEVVALGDLCGPSNEEVSMKNDEAEMARRDARPTSEALLAELREQRALLARLNAQVGSLAKELPVRAEAVESSGGVSDQLALGPPSVNPVSFAQRSEAMLIGFTAIAVSWPGEASRPFDFSGAAAGTLTVSTALQTSE